jgi:hypothetical protein
LGTIASQAVWARIGHSLRALVWMNEPPAADLALTVAAGVVLSILAPCAPRPAVSRLPSPSSRSDLRQFVVRAHAAILDDVDHLAVCHDGRNASARGCSADDGALCVVAASPSSCVRRAGDALAVAVSSATCWRSMFTHGRRTIGGLRVWGYRGRRSA